MSTESLISSVFVHNHERPPQPAMKMGSMKPIIVVCCVGVIAIIVGTTVGVLWTVVFDRIFSHIFVLTPTSQSYSMWKETPIPMYLKIHLFNWTNPQDFESTLDIKPNFVEMGPYVFREIDYKVGQVWNDDNGTVTFRLKKVWHFEESMSNGSLSDTVTNLNPVAATMAYTMRYKKDFIKMLINSAMKITKEKLTVTKTVRELLFDGYKDKLLEWATSSNRSLAPFDKFGWFYERNASEFFDGTFNMLTGSTNLSDLGMLKEWNYSNTSKFYDSTCGAIGGSLGDLWPAIKERPTIRVFAPDVCTSMQLVYGSAKEHLGLVGREYISNGDTLDNGTRVASRACYCKDIECIPSGVFNISSCKFNAPAFISLPHFYQADEIYRTEISGMNPRKEDHEFSVTIEPTTGIPMQVNGKLQLNMMIQRDEKFDLFKNMTTRVFLPMLWFAQEATLTSSLAAKGKFLLVLPILGHVTFFGIAAIGFLLLAIGTGLYIRRIRRAEDVQNLIPKTEGNGVERIAG